MRFEVSLLPLAEADIGEAYSWYFERSAPAAHAFRTEVFAAMDKLSVDPLMWPSDAEGVRFYILRHFPYTVHYQVEGTAVTVLAVAHHRRAPGFWASR